MLPYEDNETELLTCLQQTLEDNSTLEFHSPEVATANTVLRSLIQIILLPFILVLNTLVIVVVAKTKKLQTGPFYAALQVVCCNIFVSSMSTFSSVSSAIGGGWIYGGFLCAFSAATHFMLTSVRLLMLLVLAVDRTLYIFTPIAYPRIHKKALVFLSLMAWLISIVVSIVPLPGILDCYGYRSSGLVCIYVGHCHSRCSTYAPVRYVSTIMPACIIPSVLYICMYCKARALKKNTSSISAEKPKSDHKVTITFFLLFVSTVLLLLPVGALALLSNIIIPSEIEILTTIVTIVSTTILRSSFVADPIFLLKNESAKVALYKLLKDASNKWRSAAKRNKI